MIRWTTIAGLLGLLVAGVLYDRVELTPAPVVAGDPAPLSTPVMSDPVRLTTDWYCPMGAAAADSTVVVSNLGDEAAVGTIEVMTTEGPGAGLRFEIGPLQTEFIALGELDTSGAGAGALVELVGGDVVVGHRIGTGLGFIEGPCSSSTSDQWFLSAGATTRDSAERIALLNPSYDDVVFSATFQTAGRTREPLDLSAAVVPARSIRIIEVGDYVAREASVATRIEVVTGRLAVERLQIMDGTLGPIGASLTLGVPNASTEWDLTAGRISPDTSSRLTVYNPADLPAEVDVYLQPLDPADRSTYGLVPEELTVAGGRTVEIDLLALADRIGLPLPYEAGIRISSANEVGVIAERWTLAPPIDESLIGAGGTNARVLRQEGDDVAEEDIVADPVPDFVDLQPSPDQGTVLSRGSDQRSTRWVFPVLGFPDDGVVTVVVQASAEPAVVNVQPLIGGSLQPPVEVVVPAEGRVLVPIDSPASLASVLVSSDTEVAVEAMVVIPGQSASAVAAVPTVAR